MISQEAPMKDTSCEALPANRAEQLFHAIRNVNSIVMHLEHMKDKLGIQCSPVASDEEKHPQPSVALIMNEGADALNQLVNQAHESIDTIERELL